MASLQSTISGLLHVHTHIYTYVYMHTEPDTTLPDTALHDTALPDTTLHDTTLEPCEFPHKVSRLCVTCNSILHTHDDVYGHYGHIFRDSLSVHQILYSVTTRAQQTPVSRILQCTARTAHMMVSAGV